MIFQNHRLTRTQAATSPSAQAAPRTASGTGPIGSGRVRPPLPSRPWPSSTTSIDATAPYAAPAVGVYSRIPHRPASESATNANMNIALLYASYRVFLSLLPNQEETWRAMLSDLGLDPDDDSLDPSSPIGLEWILNIASCN